MLERLAVINFDQVSVSDDKVAILSERKNPVKNGLVLVTKSSSGLK